MRDSKLYVSTSKEGPFTDANTFRINILDGFSFTQDTNTQEVTLMEAGERPVRGQRVFNTSLNPVDFSFGSYVRPFLDGSSNHTSVERVLWEALVGDGASGIGTNTASDATRMYVDFEGSDVHELLKLYLFFEFENITYRINECQINQAEADFSIDGIAMITWTGQGTTWEEIAFDSTDAWNPKTWVSGTNYLAVESTASYLKNRLSSVELYNEINTTPGYGEVTFDTNINPTDAVEVTTGTATVDITVDGGTAQTISVDLSTVSSKQDLLREVNAQLTGANATITASGNLRVTAVSEGTSSSMLIESGVTDLLDAFGANPVISAPVAGTGTRSSYNIPITGGSLTINNNVTYLTPEELGVLNTSIGSFTGTRQINGELTAYLNTGAGNTGGLIYDLINSISADSTDFNLILRMGAVSASGARVEFEMTHAHITIPTINVEDVVSTTIGFSGLGQTLETPDELTISYYAS